MLYGKLQFLQQKQAAGRKAAADTAGGPQPVLVPGVDRKVEPRS
jgi:hypothetical protein